MRFFALSGPRSTAPSRSKPGAFYATAVDSVKRTLLAAYFSQIWIDDDGHEAIPQTQTQAVMAQIQQSAPKNSDKHKNTEQPLGESENPDETHSFQCVWLNDSNLVQRGDSH